MTAKLVLTLASAIIFTASTASAAGIHIGTPFGGYINKEVVSVKEMRFKNIVSQRHDFSCGAAAMATILKYFYGVEDAEEEKIVKEMIEKGDKEQILKKGFSLLDMKGYAQRQGFEAAGYRVSKENLPKINIPTVVLMNTKGYAHFVVLKGVKDGKAYIADPAVGNFALGFDEFAESWQEVVFVMHKNTDKTYPLAMDTSQKAPAGEVWRLKELGMTNFIRLPGEF